jgi:hypothetical protein
MARVPQSPCPPFLAVGAFLLFASLAPAQNGVVVPRENSHAALLRAMVVLKIAPYLTVEGAAKAKEYRIGIVGADNVTAIADKQLTGKKIDSATVKVVVVDVQTAKQGTDTAKYDLLYLATALEKDDVAAIVKAHAEKPVPLICERGGFAASGGSVQLFVKDNGLRFEVNGDSLKAQGIEASSQLLKLSQKGPR